MRKYSLSDSAAIISSFQRIGLWESGLFVLARLAIISTSLVIRRKSDKLRITIQLITFFRVVI
jgi:hypothetical protein